jgi:hypothetical protein
MKIKFIMLLKIINSSYAEVLERGDRAPFARAFPPGKLQTIREMRGEAGWVV